MSEHAKCMVPHLVKKGERLAIEGVEYVAAFVHPVPDSIFYLVTLRPYVAPDSCQAETDSVTASQELDTAGSTPAPDKLVADVQIVKGERL